MLEEGEKEGGGEEENGSSVVSCSCNVKMFVALDWRPPLVLLALLLLLVLLVLL